jgi:hypothetical protein
MIRHSFRKGSSSPSYRAADLRREPRIFTSLQRKRFCRAVGLFRRWPLGGFRLDIHTSSAKRAPSIRTPGRWHPQMNQRCPKALPVRSSGQHRRKNSALRLASSVGIQLDSALPWGCPLDNAPSGFHPSASAWRIPAFIDRPLACQPVVNTNHRSRWERHEASPRPPSGLPPPKTLVPPGFEPDDQRFARTGTSCSRPSIQWPCSCFRYGPPV